MLEKLGSVERDRLDVLLDSQIHDICVESSDFLNQMNCLMTVDETSILRVGESGINQLSSLAQSLSTHAIEISTRIVDEQQRLATERTTLQQEQKTLESGIYQFPKDALDLKAAIASRLRTLAKQDVKVVIVAEAAEIEDDRWRNAIEGYLNTQKYYIIVPDQYFRDALRVLDAMKRDRKLYGTGLVDIEKLRRKNPSIDPGSLAEEIQTSDPAVRVFLNYTLGWVHKCESVSELRRFNTSITDEGMLYQNYVVRAMNPERWAKPAIGQSAIRRRLDAVKLELTVLANKILIYATENTSINLCSKLSVPGESDIQQAVFYSKEKQTIPSIEQDLARLRISRAAIDTSAIDALKDHLKQLNIEIKDLDAYLRTKNKEQGALEERLRVCREETIPTLEDAIQELQQLVSQKYDFAWVESTAGLRYQRELSTRRSAEEIHRAFPRELSRSTNAKKAAWDNLIELRQDFNRKYIMGYDTKSEDNDAYDDAWLELSENKLPEYLSRIEDTRQKAFEQFREDFLSRLENNIRDADTQINGLNLAIKGSFFGEESFRFKIIPRPEYKRYYDMLVDPMKMEGGYNLFSEQFNLKYKDEIAELFAIITNEDGDGSAHGKSDYDIKQKGKLHPLLPDNLQELKSLLQALRYIDANGNAELLKRVFSIRCFGDSKYFERVIEARLLRILKKYLDSDEQETDEQFLNQIGIAKYPEQFEFCGALSLEYPDGNFVNFDHLCCGTIYRQDISQSKFILSKSVRSILSIENKANFFEYTGKQRKPDELVIYHGGQYSPAKRIFLQAISDASGGLPWFHWGDIDYGGFSMLARLRREISLSIEPYRMGKTELITFEKLTAPFSMEYAIKLQKLMLSPELSDCTECLSYMIENRIRLEQESILE